jgi:hypothetical protein
MRAVSFAILALGLIIGAGCSPTSRRDGTDVGEGESAVTRESQATDVEAVLKRGKWQSRPGGVAWQFADGGKVYIHDGSGDVD